MLDKPQCRVKSNSQTEAYGFILATIVNVETANCRCLIIKSQEEWDFMATSPQSLVLIPYKFLPSGIGAATSNGHTVIIPVDDKDTHSDAIHLTRLPRLVREEGLKRLGFNEEQVSVLYQDTKGYFEPLLRHSLLQPVDDIKPTWTNNTSPDILFAALFGSQWNEDNEHDRQAMEALSGLSYSEFQKNIISLSKENDPPVRLVGEVWQVIAKVDFWWLVAPLIAKPYLQRLGEIAPVILADEDPSYDLPANERYIVPKYSHHLKQNVADSLALLSVYGDNFSNQLGGEKPSFLVRRWIHRVFEENNTAKCWFSLNSCMRLLGEAAPDVFLKAVESASDGDHPVLFGLFAAEGNGILGGCYHSDLLWALEIISWNKKYLPKVSLCLARLSEIDPGGQYTNRPFNSLVEMYLGWINNTPATHNERIQFLTDFLIPQYPEVSWRLMIKLLINNTQASSEMCKPKYRDWNTDVERSTPNEAYFGYVRSIVNLLLQELDQNIGDNRIMDLVDNFDSYTDEQQKAIIERLLAINIQELSDEPRGKILKKLRSTLANHRDFPDAEWSWPKQLLDRLEEVYKHFDFEDVVKANRFLFDDLCPDFIDPIKRKKISYEERQEILSTKRITAIESVYSNKGINGVKELLSKCSIPWLVGNTAFFSSLSETLSPTAIEWLGIPDSQGEFSKGFFMVLAQANYKEAKNIIMRNDNWSSIKKAEFLSCMPLTLETIELVNSIPEEGSKYFWSNLKPYFISDEQGNLVSHVASKLLENNRPLAAIYALSLSPVFNRRNRLISLDSDLVANILIRIATNPTDINQVPIQTVRHNILESIEFLQDAGRTPERDIYQIEWLYLKIFRHEAFSPRCLIKRAAKDPTFFAQLVIWVFGRDDGKEEPRENLAEEEVRQRGEIAYHLLNKVSILPGQKGDEIERNTLKEWIDNVREALRDAGRLTRGDEMIGEYLSRCPRGKDGIWPHESIRLIIKQVKSRAIEKGIVVARRNARGVTLRHQCDGGEQERSLAQKYSSDAETIELTWPRTADILRSIAERYELEGDRMDRHVEGGN